MSTKITEQSLLDWGMVHNTPPDQMVVPMKKVISIHIDEEEYDGELAIVISCWNNANELCLSLPDGALIYLKCTTIEELDNFVNCILSYEPNF